MKYVTTILLVVLLTACREQPKQIVTEHEPETLAQPENTPSYPDALNRVLDAHGGLKLWKSMKSLVYEMPKTDFSEIHTVNLYSRKDKVETPDYAMGFDGKDVWLYDPEEKYTGDPVFYHNLMFYFYAMPFVLADKGIMYSETEDLVFEGINYPGIAIGYQQDIGTSPKDEYYIHYDPESQQMAWLGYTVTYRTGETSENVKWIRYDDWLETEGILLPKSITWYNYEGRQIKEPKNTVLFENTVLSKEAKESDFFDKPEGAVIAESKMPM